MSGNRRLVVGEITQNKLRGSALADALARELNSEEQHDRIVKRAVDNGTSYGSARKK